MDAPVNQPEVLLPLPLDEWRRGQPIGDFIRELIARGYVIVRRGRGTHMIRKH